MKPRLHFHGAAGMVTGSCFLVETAEAKVLIDCGLFQGSKTEKELNYRPFPFRPETLDAVLLTHAHIDHSGLLPKLVGDGFAGEIHATAPTVDLCSVMLADSAHIQELEVTQLNRRNPRRGKGEVAPIYTGRHVEACMARFRAVAYREWIAAAPGIRARFWNAGHLLGSASIELEIAGTEPGETLRIMFSGDIGPAFKLLHGDPEAPAGFDHVLCESTYGATDRQETSPAARRIRLRDEIRAAENPAGAVIVPSFAVERTQELLTDLVGLMDAGEVGRAPIVIDSPLAARASEVFRRHAHEMEEGEALVRALSSPQVRFTESVEESIALDRLRGFHIVIAASGMCEAGRIRRRLRNWLWRPEATILFVGFQAQGTLGRILLDGAPAVRIQGDEVRVRARLRSLDLYSGHADGPELASWIRDRATDRRKGVPDPWRTGIACRPRGTAGGLAGPRAGRAPGFRRCVGTDPHRCGPRRGGRAATAAPAGSGSPARLAQRALETHPGHRAGARSRWRRTIEEGASQASSSGAGRRGFRARRSAVATGLVSSITPTPVVPGAVRRRGAHGGR